ncbi:hypothetical protein [Nonomuraea ceibae]|uniref:hypothetical protein n=1 Tax=Nonomuraea ceibae TaxID=1935170 RepID=UPI001C5E0B99|nr:hypothetical protein [Nonomuraea ceibae]
MGELLTAAKMNTDLRNGLNFLLSGKPLASLGKSAGQVFNDSAFNVVTWDTEAIDRDNGHSNVTNNSRYVSQTAGWYRASVILGWSSNFAAGARQAYLRKNGGVGGSLLGSTIGDAAGNFTTTTVTGLYFLAVNDYVDVQAMQASGGVIEVNSNYARFEVEWVGAT